MNKKTRPQVSHRMLTSDEIDAELDLLEPVLKEYVAELNGNNAKAQSEIIRLKVQNDALKLRVAAIQKELDKVHLESSGSPGEGLIRLDLSSTDRENT